MGPNAAGGALVRRGSRADDPEERQRFVGRVLDLMLHAETGLLQRSDGDAVAEAVRCVDAVKAMAAFLGLSAVASEAQGIEGRLQHLRSASEPLTAEDRSWLLASIDRLRLLAVDPYRGPSAGGDAVIPVPLAAIERLGSIVDDLAARIVGLSDPRLVALAMELHQAAKALLLVPVRPLCQRLVVVVAEAGKALGREVALGLRGDDLAIARGPNDALEATLPGLLHDAVATCGARAPLLAVVEVAGSVVVRLSHDGRAPTAILPALRERLARVGGTLDCDSDAEAGTLIVLRIAAERGG